MLEHRPIRFASCYNEFWSLYQLQSSHLNQTNSAIWNSPGYCVSTHPLPLLLHTAYTNAPPHTRRRALFIRHNLIGRTYLTAWRRSMSGFQSGVRGCTHMTHCAHHGISWVVDRRSCMHAGTECEKTALKHSNRWICLMCYNIR